MYCWEKVLFYPSSFPNNNLFTNIFLTSNSYVIASISLLSFIKYFCLLLLARFDSYMVVEDTADDCNNKLTVSFLGSFLCGLKE